MSEDPGKRAADEPSDGLPVGPGLQETHLCESPSINLSRQSSSEDDVAADFVKVDHSTAMVQYLAGKLVDITAVNPRSDSPHDTTDLPHDTTDLPHDTTDLPHDTTDLPHDTTGSPHDTTDSPHDTTDSPHDTTDLPHNNIDAPSSVTPPITPDTRSISSRNSASSGSFERVTADDCLLSLSTQEMCHSDQPSSDNSFVGINSCAEDESGVDSDTSVGGVQTSLGGVQTSLGGVQMSLGGMQTSLGGVQTTQTITDSKPTDGNKPIYFDTEVAGCRSKQKLPQQDELGESHPSAQETSTASEAEESTAQDFSQSAALKESCDTVTEDAEVYDLVRKLKEQAKKSHGNLPESTALERPPSNRDTDSEIEKLDVSPGSLSDDDTQRQSPPLSTSFTMGSLIRPNSSISSSHNSSSTVSSGNSPPIRHFQISPSRISPQRQSPPHSHSPPHHFRFSPSRPSPPHDSPPQLPSTSLSFGPVSSHQSSRQPSPQGVSRPGVVPPEAGGVIPPVPGVQSIGSVPIFVPQPHMMPPQDSESEREDDESAPSDCDERVECDIRPIPRPVVRETDANAAEHGVRRRVYQHDPNPELNNRLSLLILTMFTFAIGIGIGHSIGSADEAFLQETARVDQHLQISELREDLLLCLRTKEDMGFTVSKLNEIEGILVDTKHWRGEYEELFMEKIKNEESFATQRSDMMTELKVLKERNRWLETNPVPGEAIPTLRQDDQDSKTAVLDVHGDDVGTVQNATQYEPHDSELGGDDDASRQDGPLTQHDMNHDTKMGAPVHLVEQDPREILTFLEDMLHEGVVTGNDVLNVLAYLGLDSSSDLSADNSTANESVQCHASQPNIEKRSDVKGTVVFTESDEPKILNSERSRDGNHGNDNGSSSMCSIAKCLQVVRAFANQTLYNQRVNVSSPFNSGNVSILKSKQDVITLTNVVLLSQSLGNLLNISSHQLETQLQTGSTALTFVTAGGEKQVISNEALKNMLVAYNDLVKVSNETLDVSKTGDRPCAKEEDCGKAETFAKEDTGKTGKTGKSAKGDAGKSVSVLMETMMNAWEQLRDQSGKLFQQGQEQLQDGRFAKKFSKQSKKIQEKMDKGLHKLRHTVEGWMDWLNNKQKKLFGFNDQAKTDPSVTNTAAANNNNKQQGNTDRKWKQLKELRKYIKHCNTHGDIAKPHISDYVSQTLREILEDWRPRKHDSDEVWMFSFAQCQFVWWLRASGYDVTLKPCHNSQYLFEWQEKMDNPHLSVWQAEWARELLDDESHQSTTDPVNQQHQFCPKRKTSQKDEQTEQGRSGDKSRSGSKKYRYSSDWEERRAAYRKEKQSSDWEERRAAYRKEKQSSDWEERRAAYRKEKRQEHRHRYEWQQKRAVHRQYMRQPTAWVFKSPTRT